MSYNFKFAGFALSEFYAVSTKRPPIEVAEYDGTLTSIPGKSGDEFLDNKRYKNVPMTREVGFVDRLGATPADLEKRFINWLAYVHGYQEFEDSDHPGMVTYAVLENFPEVQRELELIHKARLKFSRVPYWYSKAGLTPIVFSSQAEAETGAVLNNPYPADACPLIDIKVTSAALASGAYLRLIVGGVTYSNTYNIYGVNSTRDHIIFDFEEKEIRAQSADGSDVYYSAGTPSPPLPTGETTIQLGVSTSGSVDSMTIIPRWRCL